MRRGGCLSDAGTELSPRPRVEYAADGRRIYEPDGVTLEAFLFDRSEIAVIRGPWASGTSTACCQRIWQHANEQHVGSDGTQRSRWFVMRDTYPLLETTTLETWKYWFPESLYGKLYTGKRPYLHEIRVGRLVLDVWFGAYDDLRGDSVFLSLEPTGWWWNELETISLKAFFSGHGRVGRYPPVIEGGSKWSGSLADLNAPPENHWLPMMMGEAELPDDMPYEERVSYRRPPGMAYFVQPPAVLPDRDATGRITSFRLNPKAENLRWLAHEEDPPGMAGQRYYQRAQFGKSHRWIRKNLGNEVLPMEEGDPVWPGFDDMVHVARAPLEPIPGLDVWIGLDFGRNPAAVFGQTVHGQHQVHFDAAMKNAGASRFAPEVRGVLARYYPWVMGETARASLRAWGDPKGDDGTQTDERTAFDVFKAHGIVVRSPPSLKQNNIVTRIEAVEYPLDQAPGGRHKLILSKRALRLKMAMGGGYRYPREKPSPASERKPIKDRHSDVADALQYAMLGEGEGRSMIGLDAHSRPKPVVTRAPRRSLRRLNRHG